MQRSVWLAGNWHRATPQRRRCKCSILGFSPLNTSLSRRPRLRYFSHSHGELRPFQHLSSRNSIKLFPFASFNPPSTLPQPPHFHSSKTLSTAEILFHNTVAAIINLSWRSFAPCWAARRGRMEGRGGGQLSVTSITGLFITWPEPPPPHTLDATSRMREKPLLPFTHLLKKRDFISIECCPSARLLSRRVAYLIQGWKSI